MYYNTFFFLNPRRQIFSVYMLTLLQDFLLNILPPARDLDVMSDAKPFAPSVPLHPHWGIEGERGLTEPLPLHKAQANKRSRSRSPVWWVTPGFWLKYLQGGFLFTLRSLRDGIISISFNMPPEEIQSMFQGDVFVHSLCQDCLFNLNKCKRN